MPLVVHFKRPAGWQGTANIHYWDTSPADPATTWPGVAMTAEANDWYVYQFPTAEAASIVFNDGAGRQTGNLRRESAGWFYTNNTWYSLNPERPAIPVIRATPPARLYDRPQTVMLESENDDDVIWYTIDGAEPWDRSATPPAPTPTALRYQASFAVAVTTSAIEQIACQLQEQRRLPRSWSWPSIQTRLTSASIRWRLESAGRADTSEGLPGVVPGGRPRLPCV
jgi:Starch-binding module 26/Chitobiase/beta-hexosaminidase C-terminal domain